MPQRASTALRARLVFSSLLKVLHQSFEILLFASRNLLANSSELRALASAVSFGSFARRVLRCSSTASKANSARLTPRILAPSTSTLWKMAGKTGGIDRPVAWTQHVTLGAPFLESGQTQFRITATRSKGADATFNDDLGPYVPNAEFDWPFCPLKGGGSEDFRVYTKGPVAGGFSTHLMERRGSKRFSWHGRQRPRFWSGMCGGGRISRGWRVGRSTVCGRERLGTGRQ